MTQPRLHQPPNPPLEILLETLCVFPDPARWLEHIRSHGEVERLSLDQYWLIWNSLRGLGLFDCSVLDLGCDSGFFSFSLAVTMASRVTAVGESGPAIDGLRRDCADSGLRHVEVVEKGTSEFLRDEAGRRAWDAVLCLNDWRRPGSREEDLRAFYRRLGEVTAVALYLEPDGRPAAGAGDLAGEISELGRFEQPRVLGWSCSAAGEPRRLWEFRKREG